MASIYRRKKGGCFYITYQVRPGQRRTVKGCKDRAATDALARKLEADAMLRARGVIDTAVEKLSQWEAMPLEDHLKAFEVRMRGKGSTEGHVKRTLSFIHDFMETCGFTTPSNLDATKVADYILDLRRGNEKENRKPLSARTINARLTALKSLTRWLFREGRMRTDPMMQVGKLNVRTDRRHERRTLDDEEIARLIQAAQRGPDVLGISGPDRAMLYRLAVETGLRAAELASLTSESLDLADLDKASVKVAAAYSKHRRDDIVPVRRDLAEILVAFLKGRPAGVRLFAVPKDGGHDAQRPGCGTQGVGEGGQGREGPGGTREVVLPGVPRRLQPRGRLPCPAAHLHHAAGPGWRGPGRGQEPRAALDYHIDDGPLHAHAHRGRTGGSGPPAQDQTRRASARGRTGDGHRRHSVARR